MKILLLCGRPRKQGNTAHILEEISSKIKDNYSAEICYITDYNTNGCNGCNIC